MDSIIVTLVNKIILKTNLDYVINTI